MRKIDFIGVHCSASDLVIHDNIESIRMWHIARGFTDIGYNFVILKNGTICKGRPIEQIPAHIYGHNKNSIGICLTGNLIFSKEQFDSLRSLLIELLSEYGLTALDVLPHSAFNKNKTCPNFDLNLVLENLYQQQEK